MDGMHCVGAGKLQNITEVECKYIKSGKGIVENNNVVDVVIFCSH